MKRVLKIAFVAVGVIVVVIVGFVIYLSSAGLPTYDVQTVDVTVDVTPERVANGKRLSIMMCNHCHLNSSTQTLSGKEMVDLPSDFGLVYSKNITNDPKYGIGNWTDGEILFLLRTGINPKRGGEYIPPWMPKYVHVADEDLYDIIAYLRSNEPEVQATKQENGPVEPSLLIYALSRFAFTPFEYPQKPIPKPDTTDLVAFGKYLANGMFGCFDCHAADFKTNNIKEPEKSDGFYGGGNLLIDMNRSPIYSKNITSHEEFGVGSWTDEQLKTGIREGFTPDGKTMRYPMLRGRFLTDLELDAIVAYLRTVPVLSTKNIESPNPISETATEGEKLFFSYGCVSCHGASGIGYGDLTKAHMKYAADSVLVDVITNPSKYWPNTLMPSWEGRIPENEMKLLVSHVRSLGQNR